MFKTHMDLTNTLDPFKLKIAMGNRLFFKLPNIDLTVDDGGEKSKYTIENIDHTFDLSVIYQGFLNKFIFSNDQSYRNLFFSTHSLSEDITAELVTLSHELDVVNGYSNKLSAFDKEASQLNKLFQALYKYSTTKKVLIDIQDIGFKKDGTSIVVEINQLEDPNVVALSHKIGETKVKLNQNKVELQDDISLYLAGIKYDELEKELKSVFGDTITTEKPDLSGIQNDLSDMQKLIQSFLTLEISTNRALKNASSFRFSYDNGVMITLSEDETLEIGREFGLLIFYNKKANSEIRVPHFKFDTVNRPNIIEPIKSMRSLYVLFNNGALTLLDVLLYALKDKDNTIKEGTFTFKLDEKNNPEITLTTEAKEYIISYDNLLKLTINKIEGKAFVDSLYFTTDQIENLIKKNAPNEDSKIPIDTFFIWLNALKENLRTLKRYNN